MLLALEPRINAAVFLAGGLEGALDDGGSPANGAYDFRFIMYDDGVGGSQVGPAVTVNDLAVAGGIFTAPLDFGAVFQGDNRWIEVQVRAGASTGSYTTLSPGSPSPPRPTPSIPATSASARA